MAKIINLTESDIRRIVERVINEKANPGEVVSVKNLEIKGRRHGNDGAYTGKGYYNTKGQFVRHGYGEIKYATQIPITYKGNWKNDLEHGYGVYVETHDDGFYKLKGNYEKGSPLGYCEIIFEDGSVYTGYYKWSFAQGKGTYKNKYGLEFTGNWVDNELNGNHIYDYMEMKTKPKTPNQTPKTTTKPKKKCNFVSMPFKEENFCKLPTDTKWIYIKTDEGKWYTSKQIDKKTWCELTPQKFQKAIDILEPACVKSQVVAQSQIDNGTETLV